MNVLYYQKDGKSGIVVIKLIKTNISSNAPYIYIYLIILGCIKTKST